MTAYQLIPVGADGLEEDRAVVVDIPTRAELLVQNERLMAYLEAARLDVGRTGPLGCSLRSSGCHRGWLLWSRWLGGRSGGWTVVAERSRKSAATRIGVSLEEYDRRHAAGEWWCSGCKAWHPAALRSSTRGLCQAGRRRYDRSVQRYRQSREYLDRLARLLVK